MTNYKMNRPEGLRSSTTKLKPNLSLRSLYYARELRAVGHALEARHVVSLDLELKEGLYVVRGKVTASDYAQSSLSAFVQDFVSGVSCIFTGASRRSLYEIGLSYNPQDVEKLDLQGRKHRRKADQNPDPTAWRTSYAGSARFSTIGRKPPL
jgi:hypothetical protein